MKYLFFDTECANCFDKKGKIFSFGCLVTDASFGVLRPAEDILINPAAPFDWYVVKKVMAYTKKQLRACPTFAERYDSLRALADGETIMVGYNTAADITYLLDECDRYGLPPFEARYFDVQKLEQAVSGEKNVSGLSKAYEKWCKEESSNAHRSDADAEMTMKVAKAICAHLNTDMDGIIAAYPSFVGRTGGFVMGYPGEEPRDARNKEKRPKYRRLPEGQENFALRGTLNAELIRRYAAFAAGAKRDGALSGKRICVSENLELFDFEGTMELIASIAANGGEYCKTPEECDIFLSVRSIDVKGRERRCRRLNKARAAAAERGLPVIMDEEEFVSEYSSDGFRKGPDWSWLEAREYAAPKAAGDKSARLRRRRRARETETGGKS